VILSAEHLQALVRCVGLMIGWLVQQQGGGTKAIEQLAAAVKADLTTADTVATAFRRLFAARIKLGMLDPPDSVPYNNVSFDVCASSPHIALARNAAQKAMALHQNRGDVLPLSPKDLAGDGSLVLIGPTSDNANNLLGNYAAASTAGPGMAVSILSGLQNWAASDSSNNGVSSGKIGKISHAKGCADVTCGSTAGFAEAVALAKNAKATVLVLGTRVSGNNKQDPAGPCSSVVACEGEAHDRNSTVFGGHQYELAAELAKSRTGVPLICVFVHGAAMTLGNLRDSCDAILDAGFPGTQGGNGLADVVFGAVSPAGRAATTWYLNDDDLPKFGEMDLYEGKGLTYRHYDSSKAPIAFGSGLSYTTFSYSNLKINQTSITHCETVGVTVEVRNAGSVDSDEVVQLYLTTPHASVPAPKVRLADFARVHIKAGAVATVELSVAPKAHSVVVDDVLGSDQKFWEPTITVEGGSFSLYVGGGQPNSGVETLEGAVSVSKGGLLSECDV
jgi:beta-glucosidase